MPPGKRTIGSRWVYKLKLNPDKPIDRYKARLVAKGYNQIEGVDYLDSISPVVKSITVCIFLSLAAMVQSHGIGDNISGIGKLTGEFSIFASKLGLALYNLEMNHKTPLGFLLLHTSDENTDQTGNSMLDVNNAFLHGYLDEDVYMDPLEAALLCQRLRSPIYNKDLSPAKYILGLKLARSSHGLQVTQLKYLQDILADTSMLDVKPAPTPFPFGLKLVLDDRYLNETLSTGLFFSSSSSVQLSAYSDASRASCLNSRRLITGYSVFLGTSLISWKIKKQARVCRSCTEAWYRSMESTVCELLWISFVLRDLGVSVSLLIPFWCDNKAALDITANLVFHERTKHPDIDCHLVCDKFKLGFITPSHIPGSDPCIKLLANFRYYRPIRIRLGGSRSDKFFRFAILSEVIWYRR
ncbi:UNVERIFIED_CONTAM: Retrovirus-related Pol polyprotein from transposon RE2 [Sesamum radiatum]|uniref:Retrovirus-related Pol polyprotein from transposon RE2 n=1 Tax=Sesamum radiatum TaxID=300843 RepID=A0AAW2NPQ8_SESRA